MTTQNEIDAAIERMKKHNARRRGCDQYKMCSPSQLGLDIETLITAAKETVALRERVNYLENRDEVKALSDAEDANKRLMGRLMDEQLENTRLKAEAKDYKEWVDKEFSEANIIIDQLKAEIAGRKELEDLEWYGRPQPPTDLKE